MTAPLTDQTPPRTMAARPMPSPAADPVEAASPAAPDPVLPCEVVLLTATITPWLDVTRPPCPKDAAAFARDAAPAPAALESIDQVAAGLSEALSEYRASGTQTCSFDLEVPGLGRMEGRVCLRDGHADLELNPLRASAAALLRQRLQQLQRRVDQESGGDVSLFITG